MSRSHETRCRGRVGRRRRSGLRAVVTGRRRSRVGSGSGAVGKVQWGRYGCCSDHHGAIVQQQREVEGGGTLHHSLAEGRRAQLRGLVHREAHFGLQQPRVGNDVLVVHHGRATQVLWIHALPTQRGVLPRDVAGQREVDLGRAAPDEAVVRKRVAVDAATATRAKDAASRDEQ